MNTKKKDAAVIFGFCFIIASCSLNYNKSAAHFDKKPNMVFQNVTLDRYEDKSVNLTIVSEHLEMYDTDKIWAGRNIHFTQFDKTQTSTVNRKLDFKGFAGAILVDENKNEYYLGKEVYFESEKDKLTINSPALYWLKSEAMLFSPEGEPVTIQKSGEVFLVGKGFAANTLSKEFQFSQSVSGRIENKEKDENESEKTPEENISNEKTGLQTKEAALINSLIFEKAHEGGSRSEISE